MADNTTNFKGLVYGDIIGAPYSKSGTANRYFDLGQSRNVYWNGRVRTFHPQAGEPSFAAEAVLKWMSSERDALTEEGLRSELRKVYEHHPKAGWSDPTTASLSSPEEGRSATPDWAPLTRVSPLALFDREDLGHVLSAAEVCVRATCSNAECIDSARAVVEAQWMALRGHSREDIRTVMEQKYGFDFTRPESDLSAELQGQILEPLVMLGVPTGAFRYVTPEEPRDPSARTVAEAALRCVLASDGWEDAVRRAVAMQGPSSAVASIAGAFAECLYGQVTPTVEGRLVTLVPLDVKERAESLQERVPRASRTAAEEKADMVRDRVDVIFMGVGPTSRTAYIVPPGRDDIMTALDIKFGGDRSAFVTVLPEEVEAYIRRNTPQKKEGTYVMSPVPELGCLYLQKGKLVSETEYVAPGLPPVQERRRNREAFRSLMTYTLKVQSELNIEAGYHGEGQVHYENAYHPVISRNRIELRRGDSLEGAVSLSGQGLLLVEFGQMHEISADADVSEYKNAEWCRRTIFSRADAVNPLGRVQQMKESIGRFILDEGAGVDYNPDVLNLDVAGDDIAASEDPEILSRPKVSVVRDVSVRSLPMSLPEGQRVNTIYTIGHSNQTRDAFVAKLQANLVDTVVNVRSIGHSSYCPQFDNAPLMDHLSKYGISFFDAGESLGGRQGSSQVLRRGGYVDLKAIEESPIFDDKGRVDWEAVRGTDSFRKSMDSVMKLMDEGHVVALMCSEGDPLDCHRLGMLARELDSRGCEVRNILRSGEVETLTETEYRMVENYVARGLVPDTGTFEQRKEMAYRAANRLHGWRPADLLRTKWKIKR